MRLLPKRRWQVIVQRPSGTVEVENRYWFRSTAAMHSAQLTLFMADVYRDQPESLPDVFVRRDGGGRD